MNEQIGNKINDKTYIPLPPFKGFVLENFPFIEADFDAITNYQLLCKVIEYLNNVISNQNTVQELGTDLVNAYNALVDAVNLAINEFETDVTADINQFKVDINNDFDEFTTSITTQFNNLKNYVDNYFDNNFPELVSDKLDEMAEDGTLENLLNDTAHLIKVYNTYTEVIADSSTFTNGLRLKTLGYYTINDGGSAEYYVTNTQDTSKYQIELQNSLYLNLIIKDKLILEQVGIKGDGITDCITQLNSVLTFARNNNISITCLESSVFLVSQSINVTNNYIDFNNSKIITNSAIDIITINSTNYYGEVKNINIDCNNIALSGINIVEGRKHNLNNINIINVKNKGIKYTLGYENIFNNINIIAYPNTSDTIGVECLSADSHFSNIIIKDCFIGIKCSQRNIFENIHGWISTSSKDIYYHSRFIEWNGGDMNMSQIYADTYQYALYLNGTGQCGISANQLMFRQLWSLVSSVDLHGETTTLIYQTSNNIDTRDTSLYQVESPAVLLNSLYTNLSNEKFYGSINFTNRRDLVLDALIFNLDNLDESISYTSNKVVNYGDRVELNIIGSINLDTYTGSKYAINLGTIPDRLIPAIRNINYMLGLADDEYNQNVTPKYMFIGNNGNITTNLNGITGTKYFKIHMTYIKRF